MGKRAQIDKPKILTQKVKKKDEVISDIENSDQSEMDEDSDDIVQYNEENEFIPELDESQLDNLGQFESDDSDLISEGESDDDLNKMGAQLKTQKENAIQQQQIWGLGKKANYYGRNKASDDSSDTDDDKDEIEQALLLQKVKAQKMEKWMQQQAIKNANSSAPAQIDDSNQNQIEEIESESDIQSENEMKLGQKLFQAKYQNVKIKQSPQEVLAPIIQELLEIQNQLDSMKQVKNQSKEIQKIQNLKRNLLKSYKTCLAYFLYEKQQQLSNQNNNFTSQNKSLVMFKLSNLKILFQNLCEKFSDYLDNEDNKQKEDEEMSIDELQIQDSQSNDQSYSEQSQKQIDQEKIKLKNSNPIYEQQIQKMKEKKQEQREIENMKKEQVENDIQIMDKTIQRNVQKDIIKNKGLTRRRNKKDRNPRVKKRLKYEQMEKKRKNVVQEYKEGPQGVYKGQETGLKTGLIRGIKL